MEKEPRMIANKIKTLIFPVLNLLAALALYTLPNGPYMTMKEFARSVTGFPMFGLLGTLLSGVLPLLLIIVFRLDTSEYFSGELLVYILTIPVLTSTVFYAVPLGEFLGEISILIPPSVLLFGYFMYRLHSCFKNWKTSPKDFLSVIVLTLSTPALLYIGLVYDFIKGMEAWSRLGAAG